MLPKIHLVRGADRALHEQLIGQLRHLILAGELPPGTRLPPSREAARAFQVSRNIVVLAYEQLSLEGYLEARVGSGTRVRESLPKHLLRPKSVTALSESTGGLRPSRLSRQGHRLAAARGIPHRNGGKPGAFLPGVGALELFPIRTWARLSGQVLRSRGAELHAYGDSAGFRPLREAISDHIARYRSVLCTPEQIVVTSGSQQALDMIARMLVDPGDPVAIEDPGYRGAQVAFAAAGARTISVPVDDDGIDVSQLRDSLTNIGVVYTTPSHQYPLGVTLTLARRLRLLEWAKESAAWIIEDDYDSEFRYESRPLPSLQGLDPNGRVIYVGTMSKVLAPGLRIGFLVLPEVLVEPFRAARTAIDTHSPLPTQATLAEFIAKGHLERHIAKMRGIYSERRDRLRAAIEAKLRGQVEIVSGTAGLHLCVFLTAGGDDRLVSELAAERGVEAPALSDYFASESSRPGLVLGFGGAAPEEIVPKIELLAESIAIARRARR
ncbi:MAG: PLP-dependent aminotransferase family protein [Gemmatimonadota bacterium]